MNMTHRTWYIEVSQFHTKVITNATLWDLEQVLATQQLANTSAPIHSLPSVRRSFPSHHIPSHPILTLYPVARSFSILTRIFRHVSAVSCCVWIQECGRTCLGDID
jgi:hypothetical protein